MGEGSRLRGDRVRGLGFLICSGTLADLGELRKSRGERYYYKHMLYINIYKKYDFICANGRMIKIF